MQKTVLPVANTAEIHGGNLVVMLHHRTKKGLPIITAVHSKEKERNIKADQL